MVELWVFAVLHNAATPGGVTVFSVVVGVCVVCVVVACPAGCGGEVEVAAGGAGPAGVAGAGVACVIVGGGADAVEAAVFVCHAC